jgi:hypothetical protein
MLTRTVIVLLGVLLTQSQFYAADPFEGAAYIADGTANLAVVATVTDAATHKPVPGASVTAIRAGRGTTLLASDSTAMPPPVKTDARGNAVLHANFRWAGDSTGSCVFVVRSFLRVQAPGYRSTDVRISRLGRLDFAHETKHYEVSVPIALVHE